jgi:hypothetical protein
MKNKYLAIVASISISSSAYAVTVHNNDVYIYGHYDNQHSIKLNGVSTQDFTCTSGQKCERSVKFFPGREYLTIRSGRKGSAENVNWLKTLAYPLSSDPEKLNFAYILTLKFSVLQPKQSPNWFNIECPNVALAQGHWGSTNDWWIFDFDPRFRTGGLNYKFHRNGTQVLTCSRTDTGSPIYVFVQVADHMSFIISDVRNLPDISEH